MISRLKIGTKRFLWNKKITDHSKVDEVYAFLKLENGDLSYKGTRVGPISDIHGIILRYINSGKSNFDDFITGDLDRREREFRRGLSLEEDLPRSLEVPYMEAVYIDETYAPKDKIEFELLHPENCSDSFECPICANETHQYIVCPKCNEKFCYKCYCEQMRRTKRCPLCNLELD